MGNEMGGTGDVLDELSVADIFSRIFPHNFPELSE
jgi:hypothetical protein